TITSDKASLATSAKRDARNYGSGCIRCRIAENRHFVASQTSPTLRRAATTRSAGPSNGAGSLRVPDGRTFIQSGCQITRPYAYGTDRPAPENGCHLHLCHP